MLLLTVSRVRTLNSPFIDSVMKEIASGSDDPLKHELRCDAACVLDCLLLEVYLPIFALHADCDELLMMPIKV